MKAYMMCGAPGAGKSTYTQKLLEKHPDAVIVSGDSIREELYGNADIQGEWSQIQERIEQLIENNVGKTVIMDGTHYRSRYRKEALTLLASYGYSDVSAVVINPPLETCLRQNASRARKVPEEVIQKMHSSLQASLRHIYEEGFTDVTLYN